MVQLDTLYPEVLRLVVEYLDTRDAVSLSCVSKRIRDVCVISLFRTVVWTWSFHSSRDAERRRSGIPGNLWNHVRNLTYILEDPLPPRPPSPVSWSRSPASEAGFALLPLSPTVYRLSPSSDGLGEDTSVEAGTHAHSPSHGLPAKDETPLLPAIPAERALDPPSEVLSLSTDFPVEGVQCLPSIGEKHAPASEFTVDGNLNSHVDEDCAPASEPPVEDIDSSPVVERAPTLEPPIEDDHVSPVIDKALASTDSISFEPLLYPSPDFPARIKPAVSTTSVGGISDRASPSVDLEVKAHVPDSLSEGIASSSRPPDIQIPVSSDHLAEDISTSPDLVAYTEFSVSTTQSPVALISDPPVERVEPSSLISSAPHSPLGSVESNVTPAPHVPAPFESEATSKFEGLHPSVSEALSKVLPHLRVLRSFHFYSTTRGPWAALLDALLKADNLEEIDVSGTPWRTSDQRFDEAAKKTLSRKSIKRFSYLVPFFYDTTVPERYRPLNHYMGRRDEPARHTEAHNLSILLPLFSQTLKYLELPSELIDVITGVPFPKLKELKVVGPSPMFEWMENVLTQTPHLRALTILFSRQLLRPLTSGIVEEHPGFHDFVLIPPSEVDDTSISDTVVECLSKLSSFTLSSPHPTDRVFQCLPAGLGKLAFPSYPPGYREYTKRINGIHTVAISSTRLLEVFQTISHLEDLTHLEVAYSIDTHESHEKLMRFICSNFKKLTSLEVHSYAERNLHMHRDFRPELVHGTIDLLEEHLPQLSHLSCLKLNADYSDELRMTFDDDLSAPDPALEKESASRLLSFIRRLAYAVPSLCSISMLMTYVGDGYGRNDWNNWDILRSPITGEIDLCPPDGQRVLIPIDF